MANNNMNSTLPAFPIKDEVMATLKLKAMRYTKRASVRFPTLETTAENIKKGTVAPMYRLNSSKFRLWAKKNQRVEMIVVTRDSIKTRFTLRWENSFILWLSLGGVALILHPKLLVFISKFLQYVVKEL